MDVSIVIVNYNTKELTRDCLNSIYEKTHELNFDVWVVDNASKDDSCEMIKKEFPQVKLIESKENLGFGKGNNLAINQSKAKYVFLLNTDTLLIDNSIKKLFDIMEEKENSKIGVCGAQLLNEDLSLQCSFGSFHTLTSLFNEAFGFNFILKNIRANKLFKFSRKQPPETSNIHSYIFVDTVKGADMMIRKSILDRIGGFNERFFMYSEEELCFRIKKNGFDIIMTPEVEIIHLEGKSVSKSNTSLEEYKMRLESQLLFFELCYGQKARKLATLFIFIYNLRYLFFRFCSIKAFKKLKLSIDMF